MGLVNEVRNAGGTAPIGTAPVVAPPKDDPKPAARSDQASLSGARADYGPPAPSTEGKGFWGGLMDTAKSLWGRVTAIFGSKPAPAPAPTAPQGAAQPASPDSPYGQSCLDADTRWKLKTEAKIQEAKERAEALAARESDPRFEMNLLRKSRMEAQQRTENAKEPLSEGHAAVASTFENDEQREAFKRLSGEEREQFAKTYKAVGGTWAEQSEYAKKASHGMRMLLTEGKLLDTDSKGGTLLATLADHADKPLAKGLEGAGLDSSGQLQNIVNTVAYPDSVYQGENTNTCVAASLQTVLAQNDPAELARIATGLIFCGEVQTQRGDTIKLSTAELHKADGNRSTTSQLIQGSLREFGKQFATEPTAGCVPDGGEFGGGRGGGGGTHGGGRYGLSGLAGGGRYGLGGSYGGGRGGGRGTSGAGGYDAAGAPGTSAADAKSVPGGLTQFQAQEMYESVAGTLAVPVEVTDENVDNAFGGLKRALDNGFAIPVGVAGVGNNGERLKHQITILRVEGDNVIFADSADGRSRSVSIAQIKKDLIAIILPAQFADHTGWNIDRNAENPGDANGEFGGGRGGGGGTHGGGRYGGSRGQGG
jgi:hypothetical protein